MNTLVKSLFIFGLIDTVCFGKDVLLQIPDGKLNGSVKCNRFNKQFYSFQSIPYAESPVGNLRFKDPIPNKPWNKTRDATRDLPSCYQASINGVEFGQEDCLYLNVYTRKLLKRPKPLKPVMVFIHGGGFFQGSGSQRYFGPDFLLVKDIVLVTINYRLNIFGFFNLNNSSLGAPGNAGLKDQRLALSWVQKNIAYFGGNPKRVTIFGQSSVHFHILSPLSKGLFSNAIMQSGVAIGPWIVGMPNNGRLLAEALNVSTEDEHKMLTTLQCYPPSTIFSGYRLVTANCPMRWGHIHMPIIEKESNEKSFIAEDPLKLIKAGNYNKVPMLIGYTDAEGIYMEQYLRNLSGQSTPITDFFAFVPDELGVKAGTPEAHQLAEEVKKFYKGDYEICPDDMQHLIHIYRDVWFAFPARRAALEHAKNNCHPIYFYRFAADTKMNIYKNSDKLTATFKGASHCDDLGYLFKSILTPPIQRHSVEDKAVTKVVKMWTNFAKHSNPELPNIRGWKPVQDCVLHYMNIGSTKDLSGIDPDYMNMRFWLDIFRRHGISVR